MLHSRIFELHKGFKEGCEKMTLGAEGLQQEGLRLTSSVYRIKYLEEIYEP